MIMHVIKKKIIKKKIYNDIAGLGEQKCVKANFVTSIQEDMRYVNEG